MATLVKNHGRYYLQFYVRDRSPARKRVPLKTTEKRQAEKLQRRLERAFSENTFDPWRDDPRTLEPKDNAPPATVFEALNLFLVTREKEGRSPNTLRSYRNVVNLLMQTVGRSRQLRDVRPEDVETFVRDETVSANTQANRFRHVRAFVRWAETAELIDQAPTAKLTAPQKTPTLPKAVRLDELDSVCAAVPDRSAWRRRLFRFAFYTGMRSSELARLRWEHIDYRRRLITIAKQKNGKAQTIPLNAKAAAVLDALEGKRSGNVFRPEGQKVKGFVDTTSRAFKRAKDRTGIERPITFHGLRHGFCSALAEAGKPAYIIKEAARHADIQTSMIYVSIANEHLKAELDDVFGA